jgi:catalase
MTTPATDWKETVPEGEPARLEGLAEKLRDLQRRRAQKSAKPGRGLHYKAHTGASATLKVHDGLAPHLAQGLFAAPATYQAYVRFSNGAGHWQSDRTGDVRGLAIKVLGVEGKKIIPGLENAKTQDFLLIQTPSSPFRDADEFVSLVIAASGSPLLLLPRFAGSVGWGRAFGLVRALLAGINRPCAYLSGRAQ